MNRDQAIVRRIRRGRVYRGKKPRNCRGFYNDRQVLWISEDGEKIQYDSPTVAIGRKFPTIPREKFEAWAGDDVTQKTPKHSWQLFGER